MPCPTAAFLYVALHAGCGETPVWKRCFGADDSLCTME